MNKKLVSFVVAIFILVSSVFPASANYWENPVPNKNFEKYVTPETFLPIFIEDSLEFPGLFTYKIDDNAFFKINDIAEQNTFFRIFNGSQTYRTTGYADQRMTYTIEPHYNDSPEKMAKFLEEVKETSARITKGKTTDIDKLKAVNDYLVDNFEYDTNYSVYDAMTMVRVKKGVCQAYAEYAILLLASAGMDAYLITGEVPDGGHAWVGVKVDGKWYQFDPTWNDPIIGGRPSAEVRAKIVEESRYEYLMWQDGDVQSKERTIDRSVSVSPCVVESEIEPSIKVVAKPEVPVVEVKKDTESIVTNTGNETGTTDNTDNTKSGRFSDLKPNQWYSMYIDTAVESGLMQGSSGKFNPSGDVSFAELCTISARLHSKLFNTEILDSEDDNWYTKYINYCTAAGIIDLYTVLDISLKGDSVNTKVGRDLVAYMLHNAVDGKDIDAINSLDIPDIKGLNTKISESIQTMANAGIITGIDANNTFSPSGMVNRAQVATMLARILNKDMRVKK